jgi:hypothetical protein
MKDPKDQIREFKEIAKLNNPENFIAEFQQQTTIHKSYPDAYEAVEAMYQKLHPWPKYSGFKSFESVFYRWVRKKRDEQTP